MYTRNLLSNEIIKIDVPSDQIALDVLDDVELKTLFEMTKKIEDNSIIEWCRKKDRFYMLDSRNYTSVKETKHEGEIFFKGFGVSSGTATGRLKFVSGQDFHNVEKGDIIVVRFLSPDLIPLISKINGVVSECGGLTSNFSLVCRELGVPCVTDVDTSIFVENQMVIINGYTGEIFRG
jgi:pyruvate,water dikinase